MGQTGGGSYSIPGKYVVCPVSEGGVSLVLLVRTSKTRLHQNEHVRFQCAFVYLGV